MKLYLIEPLSTKLDKNKIYDLQIGAVDIALIICNNLKTIDLKNHLSINCGTNTIVRVPSLLDDKESTYYKDEIQLYVEKNDYSIPDKLMFCITRDSEPLNDILSFVYSNRFTFVILRNVSYNMMKHFENYEPKIIYEN